MEYFRDLLRKGLQWAMLFGWWGSSQAMYCCDLCEGGSLMKFSSCCVLWHKVLYLGTAFPICWLIRVKNKKNVRLFLDQRNHYNFYSTWHLLETEAIVFAVTSTSIRYMSISKSKRPGPLLWSSGQLGLAWLLSVGLHVYLSPHFPTIHAAYEKHALWPCPCIVWVTWAKIGSGSMTTSGVTRQYSYLCPGWFTSIDMAIGNSNEIPGSCSRVICLVTSPFCCSHVHIQIFCLNLKELDFLSALSLEELIN